MDNDFIYDGPQENNINWNDFNYDGPNTVEPKSYVHLNEDDTYLDLCIGYSNKKLKNVNWNKW